MSLSTYVLVLNVLKIDHVTILIYYHFIISIHIYVTSFIEFSQVDQFQCLCGLHGG